MVLCPLCKVEKPYILNLPVTFDDGKEEHTEVEIEGNTICLDCLKKEVDKAI